MQSPWQTGFHDRSEDYDVRSTSAPPPETSFLFGGGGPSRHNNSLVIDVSDIDMKELVLNNLDVSPTIHSLLFRLFLFLSKIAPCFSLRDPVLSLF
jgi:hypothetical protein